MSGVNSPACGGEAIKELTGTRPLRKGLPWRNLPLKGEYAVEKSLEQRVREHLCRVYGLGMEDVQELFEIGHGTVKDTLLRLDEAFARADMEKLADAGHMLKGTLFNMGLMELGETARALELAGKRGDVAEARSLYPGLREILSTF